MLGCNAFAMGCHLTNNHTLLYYNGFLAESRGSYWRGSSSFLRFALVELAISFRALAVKKIRV